MGMSHNLLLYCGVPKRIQSYWNIMSRALTTTPRQLFCYVLLLYYLVYHSMSRGALWITLMWCSTRVSGVRRGEAHTPRKLPHIPRTLYIVIWMVGGDEEGEGLGGQTLSPLSPNITQTSTLPCLPILWRGGGWRVQPIPDHRTAPAPYPHHTQTQPPQKKPKQIQEGQGEN